MSSPTATANATRKLLSTPKLRYLSSWFCPFAHRVTLALEHHRGRVEYEWVEALGWEEREEKNPASGGLEKVHYHWKADELVRVNPSALIPTLIPYDPTTGKLCEERAVYESLATIDYTDAISGATGKDRLVSEDPYQASRSRIWASRVNRDCCSPYYGILVRKDEKERKEHFENLVAGLTAFSKELEKTSGPTFLPEGQLSNVDLALIPHAFRYYVLEHYRGPNFAIPENDNLKSYHLWFDHVMDIPSVKRTLPNKDRYLEHVLKYAEGSARSKVANAVRRGVAAHELDDDKDGD